MNIISKSLIAISTLSLIGISSQASAAFDSLTSGEAYVGIKGGQFLVDEGGFDDTPGYGAYLGYNLDENFGFEAEYLQSSDEDIKIEGANIKSSKGEYSINTAGAYATYRHHFPSVQGFYVKGKLGLVRVGMEVDGVAVYNNNSTRKFSADEHDYGVGGGAGIGFEVMPNLSIEGEYDYLDADIDQITLGAHFKF